MSAFARRLMSAWGGPLEPGEAVFSVPATYEFIVPPSVFELSVVAVGGGGAGDDGNSGDGGGNGGNGGGLVVANALPVTPGQIITCTVGAGGAGGLAQFNTPAPSGQNTVVSFDGVTITALGGSGGVYYNLSQGPASSGSATGALVTASSGGIGGKAFDGGGGGGGAAGFGENGSLGSDATGSAQPVAVTYAGGGGGANAAPSTSVYGGNGGGGHYNTAGGGGGGAALFTDPAIVITGTNGSDRAGFIGGAGGFPGGGGGGSWDSSTGRTAAGGDGAVRIIWGSVSGEARAFPSDTNQPPGAADYTFSNYVILNGELQ